MSNLKVPPFDLLTHQASPYTGFGDVLTPSLERDGVLLAAADRARERVEEGFRQMLGEPTSIPSQLDEIISVMWAQGWNPDAANINLFSTDFGLLLTKVSLSLVGGSLVFRSETDISHLSLWWAHKEVEAFPFHKILKRLYSREGESIAFFVAGLSRRITGACAKKLGKGGKRT